MPKMDGLEATQIIRKKEQLLGYRTPIIGLSGYTDKAKEASGLQAGMDDYLTKPYEISKMLVLINELIIKSSIGSNISKKAERPIHLTMQAPSSSTLLQFERSRVSRRPEISSSAANTTIIRPTREREVQNTCCF